jgi:hypothetical protein
MNIYEHAIRELYPDWQGTTVIGGGYVLLEIQTESGTKPDMAAVITQAEQSAAIYDAKEQLAAMDKILPRHIEDLMDNAGLTYFGEQAAIKAQKQALRAVITGS